jgi:hypothetical protein
MYIAHEQAPGLIAGGTRHVPGRARAALIVVSKNNGVETGIDCGLNELYVNDRRKITEDIASKLALRCSERCEPRPVIYPICRWLVKKMEGKRAVRTKPARNGRAEAENEAANPIWYFHTL